MAVMAQSTPKEGAYSIRTGPCQGPAFCTASAVCQPSTDYTGIPGQVDATKQLPHPALHLDHLPQGIRLRGANGARVAHLGEQLRDDIVAVLDLEGNEGRAGELLEGIDDAVQELEDEKGLDLEGGRGEEEEVAVDEAEDEGRRVGVGEVD